MNRKYPVDGPERHPKAATGGYIPNVPEYLNHQREVLEQQLVGNRIQAVYEHDEYLHLELSNGTAFRLAGSHINDDPDLGATDWVDFVVHRDNLAHAVTAVESTDGYTRWHVLSGRLELVEITLQWHSDVEGCMFPLELDVRPADSLSWQELDFDED